MGDPLTEEEDPQTGSRTFGDIFDELFPHYLSMGMTPEQYWDGESGLKKAYREAYRLRIENEQRLADINNWYMGQYIIAVLQCGAMLVPGVNTKEGTQFPPYPEKPLLEKLEAERKEEKRKQQEEKQQQLAMAMFQQMVAQFNKGREQRDRAEK